MKNKKAAKWISLLAITTLIVVIGFSTVSCGGDDDGGGDNYRLTWGVWYNTYYYFVASQFSANGVNLTPAGSNAGYLTGSTAESAASYIQTNYPFNDSGTKIGSFEDLLNYKKDGIGAPQELKTAMSAQKGKTVGGIFQASADSTNVVIAFYIEKISGYSSGSGSGSGSGGNGSGSNGSGSGYSPGGDDYANENPQPY